MKSVKKIIGIAGNFGFFEKNKFFFEDLGVVVLEVKNEEDLSKIDGLFFGTSSFFQLQNFYGEIFFEKVLEKIENNFPVFCGGQSTSIFLEKMFLGKKKSNKVFEKKNISNFDGKIDLDFLDLKENKIKIFKNFYYEKRKNLGIRNLFLKNNGDIKDFGKITSGIKNFFLKNRKNNGDVKIIGNISSGENVLFSYKKTLFSLFSSEFYGNKRIYEYYLNNFF